MFDDLIRRFIAYNPDTGILTWAEKPSRTSTIGGVVGRNTGKGYLGFSFRGRHLLAHRVAWFLHNGTWPINTIDHINKDRSDNRICNLREATYRQNNCNMGVRKNNKCGFKGVTQRRGQDVWIARVMVNRKNKFLGNFKNPIDAAKAYNVAVLELHGEFAVINQIKEVT